ncbi:hypothetical protein JJB99_24210 [Bradyrhizobium diazoefficiens]|uniref:hypothetical protein n=1 Tax=Bradyrhizobium diazoefficiens TaxID=1355477 RepID=UPI00190BE708|nr:hypothetical protein [Bradyrhizobium diazoefficiens]QQO12558.1 hypothetical protein JJB99_24210 [Bradyrhizobium diazoefficiens]
MDFQSTTPAIVRAIRQRDLLNTWLRLYSREKKLPRIEDYEPSRLKEERDDLVYYDVDNAGASPVFIIQSEGTRMSRAYGQVGKGRALHEYIGPRLAALVLPIYELCLSRGRPVYTVDQLQDADGRPVEYERLLMPFGRHREVRQIIGSLKTISVDGSFEIRDLLSRADVVSRPAVRALIDKELFHRAPNRVEDNDLDFQ